MSNTRLKILFGLLLGSGCWALYPGQVISQVNGKPYQQWTAKESESLLTNSPWAQTEAGLIKVEGLDAVDVVTDSAVTVRLHSALPPRQALARLRQLKARYDQKSESEKAAFDAKIEPLLVCAECADYYVVAIRIGPNSRNELPDSMERMTLARLKLNVHLTNEKGETRALEKFVNPRFNGGNAMFFFSRFNSKGEPLISPANRTITIAFDQVFGWAKATPTRFEFDVAKMIVNGKVVF